MTVGSSYLFEVDIEIIGDNLHIYTPGPQFQTHGGSLQINEPNKVVIQMVSSDGSVFFGISSADNLASCIIGCYEKFGGLEIPIPDIKIFVQEGLACQVQLVSADITSKKYSYTINVSKTR